MTHANHMADVMRKMWKKLKSEASLSYPSWFVRFLWNRSKGCLLGGFEQPTTMDLGCPMGVQSSNDRDLTTLKAILARKFNGQHQPGVVHSGFGEPLIPRGLYFSMWWQKDLCHGISSSMAAWSSGTPDDALSSGGDGSGSRCGGSCGGSYGGSCGGECGDGNGGCCDGSGDCRNYKIDSGDFRDTGGCCGNYKDGSGENSGCCGGWTHGCGDGSGCVNVDCRSGGGGSSCGCGGGSCGGDWGDGNGDGAGAELFYVHPDAALQNQTLHEEPVATKDPPTHTGTACAGSDCSVLLPLWVECNHVYHGYLESCLHVFGTPILLHERFSLHECIEMVGVPSAPATTEGDFSKEPLNSSACEQQSCVEESSSATVTSECEQSCPMPADDCDFRRGPSGPWDSSFTGHEDLSAMLSVSACEHHVSACEQVTRACEQTYSEGSAGPCFADDGCDFLGGPIRTWQRQPYDDAGTDFLGGPLGSFHGSCRGHFSTEPSIGPFSDCATPDMSGRECFHGVMQYLPSLQACFNALMGCRIGEAANPGPDFDLNLQMGGLGDLLGPSFIESLKKQLQAAIQNAIKQALAGFSLDITCAQSSQGDPKGQADTSKEESQRAKRRRKGKGDAVDATKNPPQPETAPPGPPKGGSGRAA